MSHHPRITHASRRVTSYTALVAVLALAGCSSDPATSDPSSPAASVAAESTSAQDATTTTAVTAHLPYALVDTGQTEVFGADGAIAAPTAGEPFYGQDAQITGTVASYTDNGDGAVTDNVTGLMWTASPDLNGDGSITAADKLNTADAMASAGEVTVGGYTDWRLPTIKELYSLIDFSGLDASTYMGDDTSLLTPFIDAEYFEFGYGDTTAGERIIDAQAASSTIYVDATFGGIETMFGVNFADGRIKGYPTAKLFLVYYVRGNTQYGVNDFTDNGDGTVTDAATGLMWAQDDSGVGMEWEAALAWVQQANDTQYLGHDDWRLPNIKELQSIVDYTRSPGTTDSAAIDPVFRTTSITNEAGQTDYPYYWSSTTHQSYGNDALAASTADYLCFGRCPGYMGSWMDVHGAGAQRSDPKAGDAAEFPTGRGPQGDAIRIENFVRPVRG